MADQPEGKAIGGRARALALSPERRKEISERANAAKRDKAGLPRAVFGSEDRRITIGDITIQCYVLDDETRVLSLRSLQSGIGMSEGGGKEGARKIPTLMARLRDKGFDVKNLDVRANSPISFILPSGGVADGYDALLLPDICAVLVRANLTGALDRRYKDLAIRAATLQHGFATLGIIMLVDKVTGYEDIRKARDFGKIIEAFVAKELQPYIPKFPSEFYREICRLRDIPFDPNSVKRPAYFGHLTNKIVYSRLAPGVWEELKRKAKSSTTVRKPHLHRYLTDDVGDPRLRDVLSKDVAIMQLSDNWEDFERKLDRVLPPMNQTLQLPFPAGDIPDDGKGL